ncbi:MAG: sigma 54-interacting transcriptional regulator [Desulfatitalea sp.]|nr:sigma 54-interacting transcriptional regulator [Desulfatitalea sp.]
MKKKRTPRAAIKDDGCTFPPGNGASADAITPGVFEKEEGRLSRTPFVGLYIIQRGRFVHVDEGFCKILGYASPAHLEGRSLWDMVHPEDRGRVTLRQTPHRSPFPDTESFRILRADGSAREVRMRGANALCEGKSANVGYLMDLSAIETVENALDHYRTIINEVEDAVAEVNLDGTIRFSNLSGFRIWGVGINETIGQDYRTYTDPESAQAIFEAYNKVFRTGIPGKNIIYEIIRKDGRRRVVEDSVSPIRDPEGTITGFRTVSRDITDRREAENKLTEHRTRLEAIFRSVKDAIITVDPELRVIEANASAETICGLDIQRIVGQVFPKCLQQCTRSCCDVLQQSLQKKSTIREYRVECDLSQRHQQLVSVSSSPLLSPEGRFMGAVLVIRDITLLRDMERELRERHQYQNIIGKSKRMQEIFTLLEELADLETTVLLTGESGTGKELIAKALHYSGHRAFKPFMAVNCSALAESLLESELFGHVKGAFTGAISSRQGRFQAAHGGTILLDEVGDISPLIQLKLLRVLQEKEFERVGEATPQKVDVRVIASTNKDLRAKIRSGEFREDLYYRLKVVEIFLPPLRERLEDIPLLTDHFRQTFNRRFKKNIEGVRAEVLAKFMDYHWPGNVRELEHVIERAFVLCHGSMIAVEHLPPEIRNYISAATATAVAPSKKPQKSQDILDALQKTYWNKSKAAALLGISRQTLYRKMKTLKLPNQTDPWIRDPAPPEE